MESSNFSNKKGFEIAYAVCRIAANSNDAAFADYLKRVALSLVYSISMGEWAGAERLLSTLEMYARLGLEMGVIGQSNCQVLLQEIGILKNNLPVVETQTKNEVSIRDVFKHKNDRVERVRTEPKINRELNTATSEVNGNTSKRQTAILNFIKNKENCRLRDIQENFKDVSERTLRYDIQTLIESGKLQRVGAGGPHSFFAIAGSAAEPSSVIAL